MEIINSKQEKEKRKRLEEKVKDTYNQPRKQEIPAYLWTRGGEYKGVLEREMFLSQLPHGKDWRVLGLYNPQTHSMIFGSDSPGDVYSGEKGHTRNHEYVHSQDRTLDEDRTDSVASSPYFSVIAA